MNRLGDDFYEDRREHEARAERDQISKGGLTKSARRDKHAAQQICESGREPVGDDHRGGVAHVMVGADSKFGNIPQMPSGGYSIVNRPSIERAGAPGRSPTVGSLQTTSLQILHA